MDKIRWGLMMFELSAAVSGLGIRGRSYDILGMCVCITSFTRVSLGKDHHEWSVPLPLLHHLHHPPSRQIRVRVRHGAL